MCRGKKQRGPHRCSALPVRHGAKKETTITKTFNSIANKDPPMAPRNRLSKSPKEELVAETAMEPLKRNSSMPEGYETIAAAQDVVVQDSSSSSASDNHVETTKRLLDSYGFIRNMDAHGNIDDTVVEELPTFAETMLVQKRTIKWEAMLSQPFDRLRRRRSHLVSKRLRKGVPHALRGRVWTELCRVPEKMQQHPGLYDQLVRDAAFGVSKRNGGETVRHSKAFQKIQDTIERDIHRTFPRHNMFYESDKDEEGGTQTFCSGPAELSNILRDTDNDNYEQSPKSVVESVGGQASLRRVLKAYSMYDKEIGYCQGMNFISATFLTVMPEEEAFWMLVGTYNHCHGTLPATTSHYPLSNSMPHSRHVRRTLPNARPVCGGYAGNP